MRIIAGTLRSRRLQAPSGLATRPTSGRLRETLFNVLAPRIHGARFLDLFAGSGAVGIEARSRGAVRVDFVERNAAALRALGSNLAALGLDVERSRKVFVHGGDVATTLRRLPRDLAFDAVFLDPPYDAGEAYASTLALLGGPRAGLLSPGALAIAEHSRKQTLEEIYGVLRRVRLLEQGDAALSFYSAMPESRDERGASNRSRHSSGPANRPNGS